MPLRVMAPLATSVVPLIEELLREGHLLIAADTRRGMILRYL